MKGWIYSSPAVCDSICYFGCYNGTLYSCDTKKGKTKWIFETDAHKQDSLHVLNKNDELIEVWDDASDNSMFASIARLYSIGSVISSPTVHNGDVYFGSTDGNLYALTEGGVTGVEDRRMINEEFKLGQNYPNPFNPETVIEYSLPRNRSNYNVVVKIFDCLGQVVNVLVNKEQTPGSYKVVWNGKDSFGQNASSGLYIVRVQAGEFVQSRKMMLLK